MAGSRLASWEGHNPEYWRRLWHAGGAHFFDVVTSTNDVAAQLAAAGAPDFTLVLAEEQTRGRGRAGAAWQAQTGTSLLFSVLVRLEHEGSAPGCAPIRAGLAVAHAIARRSEQRAAVKWPNDVVIPACGKVAGVLCEAALGQRGDGYVVIGIGINVLQGEEQFAPELRGQACSIASATGMQVERSALLTEVLAELRSFATRLTEPLSDDELARIAERDILRDCEVVCDVGAGRTTRGVARGVARDGALLVEGSAGMNAVYNATVRLAAEHTYPGTSRG